MKPTLEFGSCRTGKLTSKPTLGVSQMHQFGEICDGYLADQLAKAESTVACERIHIGHLKRVLGESAKIDTITLNVIQGYVNTRSKTKCRGKAPLGDDRSQRACHFPTNLGLGKKTPVCSGGMPHLRRETQVGSHYPEGKEKEKFQTWGRSGEVFRGAA